MIQVEMLVLDSRPAAIQNTPVLVPIGIARLDTNTTVRQVVPVQRLAELPEIADRSCGNAMMMAPRVMYAMMVTVHAPLQRLMTIHSGILFRVGPLPPTAFPPS